MFMRITMALFFMFTGFVCRAQDRPALVDEYLQKWQHSKEYTLEMVTLLPEDKLDFRAADSTMTFRKQVLHITRAIVLQSGTYLRKQEFDHKIDTEKLYSKQELLTNLADAFDFATHIIETLTAADLEDKVDFFAGRFTKRQMLNVMDDHITHHKGQLVVYLRLNGIKPPRYMGW